MYVLTSEQHDDLRILLDSPCAPEQQIIEIAELLTLPQIKQLAEQHSVDIIQWTKWDFDDKDKQPVNNSNVLVKDEDGWIYTDTFEDNKFSQWIVYNEWAYLPQPKEK